MPGALDMESRDEALRFHLVGSSSEFIFGLRVKVYERNHIIIPPSAGRKVSQKCPAYRMRIIKLADHYLPRKTKLMTGFSVNNKKGFSPH